MHNAGRDRRPIEVRPGRLTFPILLSRTNNIEPGSEGRESLANQRGDIDAPSVVHALCGGLGGAT